MGFERMRDEGLVFLKQMGGKDWCLLVFVPESSFEVFGLQGGVDRKCGESSCFAHAQTSRRFFIWIHQSTFFAAILPGGSSVFPRTLER